MAAIGEDGKAMALLTYVCVGEEITLGYTATRSSTEGTHIVLFNALVDRATKQGNIVSIDSRTHANNLAAQAAFEAQGRTKEYITYTYPLKDRRDGKGPTDEEMRMPEYSSSPSRPRRPQEHAGLHKREKAAEGYALHQAVPESKYRWVLIFSSLSSAQRPAT
ncbi:hypothetical protein [Sinorhizobium meliloti]|uniref:hypothetical protein n=1 Tax=Rhizobium meliloti TaxID=382 RepID=UPI0001E4B1A5|nr:hypothetical protein [Sinorhizobium meliloti]AEG57184.1 hypothetical protein Sinme_5611 [Sinorhizobium meliloti AK83]MDE4586628.1 hypothetical protein [Sinorhizobium meliloti]SEJ86148.1 hypothetical protein SAMN04244575_06640 [Sinorhizobium meliloti]